MRHNNAFKPRGYGFSLIVALGVVSALGACSTVDRYLGRSEPVPFRTIFSANGEVLNGGPLGRRTCEQAMTGWIERIDANRDGRIDRNEFFADARRQFAVMDIDRDGVIFPVELDQYRAPFTAPPDERPPGSDSRQRAETSIRVSQPDPVMSSDVRLRNQVSLPDFLTHAEKVFTRMDRKHSGFITRDDAIAECKANDVR